MKSGALQGIPAAGTLGTYQITITAHNGIGSDAEQSFTLTVDKAPPKVIRVGAREAYTTLQDAYAAAQDGDLLLIDDGTYTISSTFVVDKQVTFQAVNVGGAIVSGGGSGPDDAVFRLNADATFVGLHLKNATNGLYQRDAGVHGIAKNLIITGVTTAIGINNSAGTTGSFDVLNSTIVGVNTGINVNDGGTINVVNTIFANVGTAYVGIDDIAVNPDHNLLFNVTTVSAGGVSGDPAQLVADPLFVNAGAGDYHLLHGSPAIDSGTKDGLSFTGSAPDRGALEWHPVPSPGDLDLSFGAAQTGMLTSTFPGFVSSGASAIAVLSDGKIVVAGWVSDGTKNDFAVTRYLSDGELDKSFGTDGLATADFGPGSDEAEAVAIQPDGKIVVAGGAAASSGEVFAVARFNSNGSLDDGSPNDSTPGDKFGVAGMATADFAGTNDDFAYSVALQSTGKIVVGGYTGSGFPTANFGLVRYNTDGTLDSSFGTNGLVSTDLGAHDFIRSLVIQSDNKIVAGGLTSTGSPEFALAPTTSPAGSTSIWGTRLPIANHNNIPMRCWPARPTGRSSRKSPTCRSTARIRPPRPTAPGSGCPSITSSRHRQAASSRPWWRRKTLCFLGWGAKIAGRRWRCDIQRGAERTASRIRVHPETAYLRPTGRTAVDFLRHNSDVQRQLRQNPMDR